MTVIRFKVFTILVRDGEEERFIARLDALCREYAQGSPCGVEKLLTPRGQAYHFIFDSEEF